MLTDGSAENIPIKTPYLTEPRDLRHDHGTSPSHPRGSIRGRTESPVPDESSRTRSSNRFAARVFPAASRRMPHALRAKIGPPSDRSADQPSTRPGNASLESSTSWPGYGGGRVLGQPRSALAAAAS